MVKTTSQKEYNLKIFTISHPLEYDGDPDPIVNTNWISEIEGAFRITKCLPELKTIYGASRLRGGAKRWWDEQIRVKEFYKSFRPEAKIAKLRAEFSTTPQGSLDLNSFKNQFLDKVQFFPEYLNSDDLLKEHFHRLLRTDLRKCISLVQMKSFTELYNVSRGFKVEDTRTENLPQKRKIELFQTSSKKVDGNGTSGGGEEWSSDSSPCHTGGKMHLSECWADVRNCYRCGKQGHFMKGCTS
uniref:uncharacterized protein LOC122609009 n=1 Tax=Erigeron canadensis TaxID=72917 RepID=UPI001CB974A2|nr:uncharacterized protein LOC122609009 [Erigeron canadensis]